MGEAGKRLGLEPVALCANSDEPGFRACRGSYLLQPGDPHPIHDFLASVEAVTFENEFFPQEIVREAGEHAKKFRPSLDVIGLLRDKLRQKELFVKLGVPTAPFRVMSGDAGGFIKDSLKEFGGEAVLKWSLYGYDGKGVFMLNGSNETAAAEFCRAGTQLGAQIYAEKKIAFRHELAMVTVRDREGFSVSYPLVVSRQEKGVCKLVMGPARHVGVSQALEGTASGMCGKLAVGVGLVGAFAMEFFEDDTGKLLANEMSPRVHNSAHYSIEASVTDQFTNHLQAVMGGTLGDPTLTVGAFAMLNLLGPEKEIREVVPFRLKLPEGVAYHDYGKRQSRPGRKMGHLTGTVETPEELPAMVETLQRLEREWIARMNEQA